MTGWETKQLGDILQLNYGKSLPVKDRFDGPIPVYGSNGIVGVHNKAIVDEPGLIVGRKGSAGQVHKSTEPFCPIDTTFFITANDAPEVDLDFLYYLLLYIDLKRIVGDVGVPGLNREMAYLEKASYPVARHEQKTIAQILSTVQRAIEAQDRIIQTTTELKKALMQKLFTEGLRNEPQKQTEIGAVPASWEVKKVGEIAELKSGGTPSRKIPEFWDGGNIPWVKTGEVDYCTIADTEEKITKAGLEQSSAKLFPVGTLVMAMYGQGITRGKVAILGIEATTNQACVAFFPKKDISPRYLYFFFEYHYDGIRNFAHGANQKNLSAEIIKSYPVSFPRSIDEQIEITAALHKLDDKIRTHNKKKEALQKIFRTLLHELMSAQTRVTNLVIPAIN